MLDNTECLCTHFLCVFSGGRADLLVHNNIFFFKTFVFSSIRDFVDNLIIRPL